LRFLFWKHCEKKMTETKLIIKLYSGEKIEIKEKKEEIEDITILKLKNIVCNNKNFQEIMYQSTKDFIKENENMEMIYEYDKKIFNSSKRFIEEYEKNKEEFIIPIAILSNFIIKGKNLGKFDSTPLKELITDFDEDIIIQIQGINILKF
jgi:hypothetical protein